MDGTLEILHRARDSLTDGAFSFHDWTQCTCGHLFTGAAGHVASGPGPVRSPERDTPYAAVVLDVARALSGDERRFGRDRRAWYAWRASRVAAVHWISDYTMRRARRELDVVRRADAIAVIDEAIARLEAAEERVLLDVHERPLPA
jgi:hypothetical protein